MTVTNPVGVLPEFCRSPFDSRDRGFSKVFENYTGKSGFLQSFFELATGELREILTSIKDSEGS
jgi:hypothetical protein